MLELKIEGLDQLDKAFEEVSQALESLGQQIGAVRFNPGDPNDVDRAISEAQRMVDAKLWRFKHNPWVSTISDGLKEKIREGIIDKARQARGDDSERT
jgi:hypothetical protein